MNRAMRRGLLALNYLAVVLFAFGWAYLATAAPLHAAMKSTELDRAGVINEAKLKEFDPRLAENLRWNVGSWVAQDALASGILVTQIGLVVAIGNLVVLHVAGARTGRDGQPVLRDVQGDL